MKLGILCGGGPAPGINSVISAATIEARNSGWEVVGIHDGFEHLIDGPPQVDTLEIGDVSRIHGLGGTILGTSRANPTKNEEYLQACVLALKELQLHGLITIGGDDTAFSATRLAEEAGGTLKVVHVPKTIDNDLPLPGGQVTFGFQTARHVGVNLVTNLLTDATATKKWYFVVAMGRTAGHLALGIGKASGATVTVIAEEFPAGPIPLKHVADILETSMLKRVTHGRPFGVAVIAEGIGERLPEDELAEAAPDIERDEHGHIRLEELNLHRILADVVSKRFKERGEKVTITAKNIGYELRGAPPIPWDIDYTRDLGWGAFDHLRMLHEGDSREAGAMITLHDGNLEVLPFGSFNDPKTGRPMTRLVDLNSTTYKVATEYMIRLKKEDFDDPAVLSALADVAGMSIVDFTNRYGYLTKA
ncbi:MAG: diphosphate--fructose-6-phosphate 1-phosphotransferase [Actinomycetota bacterium]